MKALVKITNQVKTYLPGDSLGKEFSKEDIERLIRKKAVEAGNTEEEELFDDNSSTEFLDEKALKKFSSKAKLIDYAKSIGLENLVESETKDKLIDAILNYIAEQLDVDEELFSENN